MIYVMTIVFPLISMGVGLYIAGKTWQYIRVAFQTIE